MKDGRLLYGHEPLMDVLINHPNLEVDITNDGGWSALMLALKHGHERAARLLLKWHPQLDINAA